LVLKLKSGYNIGLEIEKIKKIEKISSTKKNIEKGESIEKNPSLPKILLLSTGGTIASKVDYRTGAVTPVLSAEELNSSVPELSKIANIDAEVLFSEYSENIMPDHWLKIAEKLKEHSASDYSGIIIAHGTDTMHYTSSFLSFALAGFPIPIALVGSQRSSDRASSDAALNLIGAIKFLIGCKTNGVYIVMHQDENDETVACHLGTRVRKNHTSKRGAFQTIGDDPAFIVVNDQVQRNTKYDFFKVKEFQPRIKINTKVALVKYHPGYDPSLLEKIIEMNYSGIIFEGTGLGHIGKTMYENVKKANEKGIFLGMTSQCIDGRVRMTVYESGRDLLNLGIISLENMIPEVALVKAMWALGNSETLEDMKHIMLQNIASEISD
jgi:glutamyl-tRNA(Gln) amidotransferase subunit D